MPGRQPDLGDGDLWKGLRLAGQLGHIITLFRLRENVALVNQSVVSGFHRDAAYTEVPGKVAFGGKPGTRRELPGKNILPQKVDQLFVQGLLILGRECVSQQDNHRLLA